MNFKVDYADGLIGDVWNIIKARDQKPDKVFYIFVKKSNNFSLESGLQK